MKTVKLSTLVMFFCLVNTYGANLIQNGDFELGNTGFYTDYFYSPLNTVEQQTYAIDTDPAHCHPKAGGSYGDHTTGYGKMYIGNASTDWNQIVWQQSVAVTPNTNYDFSFWCMNWSGISYNLSELEYSINNIYMGSITVPPPQGIWGQASTIWGSQANTSATIKIVETAGYYIGSDFALDDISMSEVPEPATMSLLAIGGLVLRRRK